MARYDKYDPKDGGFRAPLAADFPAGSLNTVVGVGLDTSGRVVVGGGNTGVKGGLVLTKVRRAGEVVDVMTDGEIVEFPGVAGTNYYADAAGVVSTTNTGKYLGCTVEGTRLVVRAVRA